MRFILSAFVFSFLLIRIATPSVGFAADKESIEYWKAQIRENPNQAINYFNLAVALRKKRKFRSAIKAFAMSIRKGSKLEPVARYYMAQIYKEKNRIDYAKSVIAEVDVNKAPENLKQRILILKNNLMFAQPEPEPEAVSDELREAQQEEAPPDEKRFSIYLDGSYGSNDNPGYEHTPTYSNDSQTKYSGTLGYIFWLESTYDWSANYTYSGTTYAKNDSSNSSYHDVTLPFSYYFKYLRLRLTPEYLKDTYGSSDFSQTYGSAFDATYKDDSWQYIFYLQHLMMSMDNSTYDYLAGNVNKFKVSVKKTFESSYLSLGLAHHNYNYEDASSASSYKNFVADLTWGMYFDNLDVTPYLAYETRRYDVVESSDTARKDSKWTYNLQIGYAFNRYLRLYADATRYDNSSNNSTSYGYNQTTYIGGLTVGY